MILPHAGFAAEQQCCLCRTCSPECRHVDPHSLCCVTRKVKVKITYKYIYREWEKANISILGSTSEERNRHSNVGMHGDTHTPSPPRAHTLARSHAHARTLSRSHALTLSHSHVQSLTHPEFDITVLCPAAAACAQEDRAPLKSTYHHQSYPQVSDSMKQNAEVLSLMVGAGLLAPLPQPYHRQQRGAGGGTNNNRIHPSIHPFSARTRVDDGGWVCSCSLRLEQNFLPSHWSLIERDQMLNHFDFKRLGVFERARCRAALQMCDVRSIRHVSIRWEAEYNP